MVDIYQIAIQVQVGVSSGLDCCVGGLTGCSAWRKGHLCEEAEWRDGDLGEGLRCECFIVDDYFLDIAVARLLPEWSKRCHSEMCAGKVL